MLLFLTLCSLCLCGDISFPTVPKSIPPIHADSLDTRLPTGLYYIVEEQTGFRRRLENTVEEFDLLPTPIVTATNFASVELATANDWDGEFVSVQLDAEGTIAFSRATAAWLDRRIGVVVDNRLIMAPVVRSRIDAGKLMITGTGLTKADMKELKRKLEEGRRVKS